jgi:hypothetical protein
MSNFRKSIKNKKVIFINEKKNLTTLYIQLIYLAYIKICEIDSDFLAYSVNSSKLNKEVL